MKYEYLTVEGQTNISGRVTKRPVVEVALSRGNQRRVFLALVDSGADQITMPSYIAEALGIDRSACPKRPVMGISMELVGGFVAPLALQIARQEQAFEAPVVFVDYDMPVLLGREGFFDRYCIKFEQDHDVFEITPQTPKK
jgi:hypothetical protein